jgi:PAS domain S-box-containing protein
VDPAGAVAAVAISLLLVARQGIIAGQMEMRQFASLVHSTSDLAFVCDSTGRLLLSNPALRSAIGARDEEDASTRNVKDIAPALAGPLHQAKPEGWGGEVVFRTGEGPAIPVALTLRPVRDERHRKLLWAGTGFDLTKVKEREGRLRAALEEVAHARAQLESWNAELEAKVLDRTQALARTVTDLESANQELKELDRLKTEFIALVSHELRSPLANIQTGLELTLDSMGRLPPAVDDSLRLVQAEALRLSRFVETVLDLSALEAGRISLRPGPISVEAAARSARDRFPDPAGRLRLKLEVPEDLPLVLADERALESVLFHLLDNALKYAERGTVRVQAEADNGSVRVSVTDEGPGIVETERDRIFEMFHRIDASDSRRVYGHGLGLPLTRRLLQAMGGDIELAGGSRSGGARFIFWLPRAEPADGAMGGVRP